jgi:PAS domain-containing protein
VRQWELRGVTVEKREDPDRPIVAAARSLVDQIPAMFWTTDQKLRFTSSLGAGLARLGLGPNQLVGTSLFEFFETEDPKFPAIEAHVRALRGETVSFELAWGELAIRARVAPLRDSDGRSIGAICVALDTLEGEPTWNLVPSPRVSLAG